MSTLSEDVHGAVLELPRSRLSCNIAQARKETPDARQRLKSLLVRHLRTLRENRAIPHIVFSGGLHTGQPERKAKLAEIITTYLGSIQKIVEGGHKDGTVREDVVSMTVAVMFIGMILPAAILLNSSDGRFDVIEYASNAWPAFERCIAAEK
ncbi:MAG: TetR/AcrR family transcriptional regulator C-terminal domain-containing protein [Candidatus Zixiibacteriota bacterium]